MNFFVANSAAGAGDGSSAENALAVSWLQSASNWANPKTSEKVGPGDTVVFCGTITSAVVVYASGTSGSPITLLFNTGAKFSSPAWANAIIDASGRDYIVVDGGATGVIGGKSGNPLLANGIIESTANGTGQGQEWAAGVYGGDSHYLTVRNLVIRNLYVRVQGTDAVAGSFGVYANWMGGSAPANITVDNCIIHDMQVGCYIDYGPSSTNITMSRCTAYNVNWGGNAGDHGATSTLNGITIHDNWFHSFTNWDGTDSTTQAKYHHNGFYVWAESGGSCSNITAYNNYFGPNYSTVNPNGATAGLFVSGYGIAGPVLAYNNILEANNSGGCPSNGLMFIWPGPDCVTRIYNNTAIGDANCIAFGYLAAHGSAGSQTLYIANNIAIAKENIAINSNAGVTVYSDKNLFFESWVNQEFSYSVNSSGNFKTFAQWQALGFDANSYTTDPNLDLTYKLASPSDAIGNGENLSTYFTTDFAGATRTVPWDIGAYGYGIGAPTAPSVLTATAISTSVIGLGWTNNDATADGIYVERSSDGTNYAQIASLAATDTTYSATGLASGTQYWFRVRSYSSEIASGYSNVDDATTSAAPAPTAGYVTSGNAAGF
jgi:hypothetical protein